MVGALENSYVSPPYYSRNVVPCESHSVMSNCLWPHGLYSPWNSPGQNTGVGSHSLLQGIFPTQGSNPGLLHCRWILYQLSHQGSPRILEWVTYPFSSRFSWPRIQTRVSCIAGGFFTNWATRKPHNLVGSGSTYIPQSSPHLCRAMSTSVFKWETSVSYYFY